MRGSRLLLALAAAFGLLVLIPAPSYACSCVQSDDAAHFESADVVVTGTVTDVVRPILNLSQIKPTRYVVDVEAVYKGDPPSTVVVDGGSPGDTCALEFIEANHEYLLFLQESDDGYRSGLCSGNRSSEPAVALAGVRAEAPPHAPDSDVAGVGMPLTHQAGLVAGAGALALMALVAWLWRRYARL